MQFGKVTGGPSIRGAGVFYEGSSIPEPIWENGDVGNGNIWGRGWREGKKENDPNRCSGEDISWDKGLATGSESNLAESEGGEVRRG